MYTGKLIEVGLEATVRMVTNHHSSEVRSRMYVVRFFSAEEQVKNRKSNEVYREIAKSL